MHFWQLAASPVMAHAPEEMADMVSIASALVINTGTPSQDQLAAMKAAIQAANEQGKPWILDPVGAGATPYRLALNLELLELQPTAIRGNASEILTLLTGTPTGRGVDSASEDDFNKTLDYLQERGSQSEYSSRCNRRNGLHNRWQATGHPYQRSSHDGKSNRYRLYCNRNDRSLSCQLRRSLAGCCHQHCLVWALLEKKPLFLPEAPVHYKCSCLMSYTCWTLKPYKHV